MSFHTKVSKRGSFHTALLLIINTLDSMLLWVSKMHFFFFCTRGMSCFGNFSLTLQASRSRLGEDVQEEENSIVQAALHQCMQPIIQFTDNSRLYKCGYAQASTADVSQLCLSSLSVFSLLPFLCSGEAGNGINPYIGQWLLFLRRACYSPVPMLCSRSVSATNAI